MPEEFYSTTRDVRAWFSDSRSPRLRWRPVEGFLRLANRDNTYRFVPAILDEATGALIAATDVLVGRYEGATSTPLESDRLKERFARTHTQHATTKETR